jgi:hypothetical protein
MCVMAGSAMITAVQFAILGGPLVLFQYIGVNIRCLLTTFEDNAGSDFFSVQTAAHPINMFTAYLCSAGEI